MPPILYTFRRCPYAIRARMAIHVSEVSICSREVLLRDKPDAMLEVSPKGTVPVLVLKSGEVIDESLEIMRWALAQHDPKGLLHAADESLIRINDQQFKPLLDRYKYPGSYPNDAPMDAMKATHEILADWNDRIARGGFLLGSRESLSDLAIFPFVRQFAHVDRAAFAALELVSLRSWLDGYLASASFASVMDKRPIWQPE